MHQVKVSYIGKICKKRKKYRMQKKSKKIKQYNVIEYKIQRELITILKEKEEKKEATKCRKKKRAERSNLRKE